LLVFGKVGSHTEVAQQNGSVVVNEEVGRFDIPMDEAINVKIADKNNESETLSKL
jgi:hypothetical protein